MISVVILDPMTSVGKLSDNDCIFVITKSKERSNVLFQINALHYNKELLLKIMPLSVNSQFYQFLSINYCLLPPPRIKRGGATPLAIAEEVVM